jgi:hypothetical protein
MKDEEFLDRIFLASETRSISLQLYFKRHTAEVRLFNDTVSVHRMFVGKPEKKRPLGRPRRRLEVNIKKDLQEVGGGRVDWIELAQVRDRWRTFVGTVRDFRVP